MKKGRELEVENRGKREQLVLLLSLASFAFLHFSSRVMNNTIRSVC